MPYWCADCRSYFSVKTGTAIARSKVPLRKWAIAIYLCLTSLKSVSSLKLHRDIGVSQPTAWFMLHRIREAWAGENSAPFDGPVEVDETYIGGRKKNMSKQKRRQLGGRGPAGKSMVIEAKDRATNQVSAQVIGYKDGETMQGFVADHAAPGAKVYTDTAGGYHGMTGFDHEQINHNVGEYVRGMAHTKGVESFWSMLKRAHKGTFHKISPKHLDRYVHEFAGKHNIRDSGTLTQMRTRWPALLVAAFSTATSSLTTALPAGRGLRLGCFSRARASFVGVAPLRSRARSSIGASCKTAEASGFSA